MPIGYGIGQILTIIIIGWTKYQFGVFNFFSTLIFDLLLASPFLVNIVRYTKKYNYAVKFFEKNKNIDTENVYDYQNVEVKCVYQHISYEIGEIYKL